MEKMKTQTKSKGDCWLCSVTESYCEELPNASGAESLRSKSAFPKGTSESELV